MLLLQKSRRRDTLFLDEGHAATYVPLNEAKTESHFKETIMATQKTDSSNFEAEVLNSDIPVVVDFWAEWCGPCKMIAPSLEEISTEMAGKVKIAKLNMDENPELAARYGVRSIPTLLMFKGGEPVAIQVGAAPKNKLSAWITSEV
jgi:thioredoxin 1